MDNNEYTKSVIAELKEEASAVDEVLKEVGSAITLFPRRERQAHIGRCDQVVLSATFSLLRLERLIEALGELPGAGEHKRRAEQLKSEIEYASAVAKILRTYDTVPTVMKALEDIHPDGYFETLASRHNGSRKTIMPKDAIVYRFSEHLALFLADEVYRNILLDIVWAYGTGVSEDLISAATELYKQANLCPALIVIIFIQAALEAKRANNPEMVVSAEKLRNHGWELAALTPEDQSNTFDFYVQQIFLVVGSTVTLDQCAGNTPIEKKDTFQDLFWERNYVADEVRALYEESLANVMQAVRVAKTEGRDKAEEYLQYAAHLHNKTVIKYFDVKRLSKRLLALPETEEAITDAGLNVLKNTDDDLFCITRELISSFDEVCALDFEEVLKEFITNKQRKRIKGTFDSTVYPPVYNLKDVSQMIHRSPVFRKMAFLICLIAEKAKEPAYYLIAALTLYKETNLHPAVILAMSAETISGWSENMPREENIEQDHDLRIANHIVNACWLLAANREEEKIILAELKSIL